MSSGSLAANVPPYVPIKDTEYVYDSAQIDFSEILRSQSCWVIGNTIAQGDPHTAVSPIPDAIAEGDRFNSQQNRDLLCWYGQLTVTDTLVGIPQQTKWDYVIPLEFFGHQGGNPAQNAGLSPLQNGNYVVCKVDSTKNGQQKFNPIYIIYPAWLPYVSSGMKYYRFNGGLVAKKKSIFDQASQDTTNYPSLETLESIVKSNKNPYLAISAYREIVKERLLSCDIIQGVLKNTSENSDDTSSFMCQAVMTELTLRGLLNPGKMSEQDGINTILNVIKQAHSSNELKGISLGAFTMLYYPNSKQVLLAISEKEKNLNTQSDADEYIDAVLQAAGIRLIPPAVPNLDRRRHF